MTAGFLKLSTIQAKDTSLDKLHLPADFHLFLVGHDVRTAESLYGLLMADPKKSKVLLARFNVDFDQTLHTTRAAIPAGVALKLEQMPEEQYGTGDLSR
jgi:hypothetical protein